MGNCSTNPFFKPVDDDKTLDFLETPDADISSVTLSGDGRYLGWTTNEDGYAAIHMLNRESGEMLEAPELPPGVYGIVFVRCAVAEYSGHSSATPGDVVVWNVDSGASSHTLQSTFGGLDPNTFVVPESLRYPARDGLELQGLLYVPVESQFDFKPPVVVKVHGGPTGQSRPTFQAQVQYLVNNGISNQANRVAFYRRLVGFLEEQLTPEKDDSSD